jgi:hypothetical protein
MRRMSVCILLFLTLAGNACAHAVGVDYRIRSGKVEVEVYFDDGSAVPRANVQIVNGKDEVIAEGVTDKEGRWIAATPRPGQYEIRVDAGAGHRAKKKLDVPEPPPAPEAPSVSAAVDDTPSPERLEFTRFRWDGLLFGCVAIAAVSGALLVGLRMRQKVRTKP